MAAGMKSSAVPCATVATHELTSCWVHDTAAAALLCLSRRSGAYRHGAELRREVLAVLNRRRSRGTAGHARNDAVRVAVPARTGNRHATVRHIVPARIAVRGLLVCVCDLQPLRCESGAASCTSGSGPCCLLVPPGYMCRLQQAWAGQRKGLTRSLPSQKYTSPWKLLSI
jgi:hypothetical protein